MIYRHSVRLLKISLISVFILLLNSKASAQITVEENLNQKAQFAKSLVFTNPAKGELIADTIIRLSQKNKLALLEATGWNIKGVINAFTSSPDSALKYFNNSERLALKANNKLALAKAIANKNIPLQEMGKYDLAIRACLDAIKIYEELGNYQLKAGSLADIGNILVSQKRPKDAIQYFKEAISISFELKEENMRPNFYNSLGVAYLNNNQYESALKIYREALKLAEKNKNLKNQISINLNLGDVLWRLNKNATESLSYLRKAEKLALDYGDKPKLSIIYQDMSIVYDGISQAEKSIEYAKKARNLAIETKQAYTLEKIYASLAAFNAKAGDFRAAYQSALAKDSLNQIILNETNNKNLNEIRTKYETEKKDLRITLLDNQNQLQKLQLSQKNLILSNNELELKSNQLLINNQDLNLRQQQDLLSKQELEATNKEQKIKILDTQNRVQKLELMKRNIIIAIIIGVLLLLIIIAILLYNRSKIKNQNKLQSEMLKQQEKAAQAVIKAEESERQRIAGELHDGLGQLFSAVKLNLSGITDHIEFKDEHSKNMFSKTMGMIDESCREVRVISHQMAPNVLLKSGLTAAIRDFINKIDARKLKINLETFGLQHKLDQNIEAVLYRIIQESVNNVIKHAEASSLDIQLSRDEDGINAMIEDNGKGFSIPNSDTYYGMGLKNIISRVNYLKGAVEISSEPGKGTLVAIHIPNKAKS